VLKFGRVNALLEKRGAISYLYQQPDDPRGRDSESGY
jgi:hypothetical protein